MYESHHTEFEFNFFKTIHSESDYNYCAHDPNIYMHGTRDSAVDTEDHAFIIYEVSKCTEDTRQDDDPECAPMNEINEWLSTKILHLKIIDGKIDFDSFDDYAVR